MKRSYTGVWLTGMCILLMGCETPLIPTPFIEDKKYELEHERNTMSLNFTRNKAALLIDEQLSLQDYLQPVGAGKTSIHVTMTCKTSGITGKRVHYLTKYLLSLGIKKKQIHCDSQLDPETPDVLDIVINKYRVILPRCPDWRMGLGNAIGERNHSNYGCATLTNFLLMIDDPIVLFKGTPAVTHDAPREALAIANFRSGKDRERQLKSEKIASQDNTGIDKPGA